MGEDNIKVVLKQIGQKGLKYLRQFYYSFLTDALLMTWNSCASYSQLLSPLVSARIL